MDVDIVSLFGLRVRQCRVAKGLSQQDLAERANLSRSYIGEVELGRRNITLSSASRIAKALDVEMRDLLI